MGIFCNTQPPSGKAQWAIKMTDSLLSPWQMTKTASTIKTVLLTAPAGCSSSSQQPLQRDWTGRVSLQCTYAASCDSWTPPHWWSWLRSVQSCRCICCPCGCAPSPCVRRGRDTVAPWRNTGSTGSHPYSRCSVTAPVIKVITPEFIMKRGWTNIYICWWYLSSIETGHCHFHWQLQCEPRQYHSNTFLGLFCNITSVHTDV